MSRPMTLAAVALLGVLAATRPAPAQTTTLTMSSWVSPQHHVTLLLQSWATEAEKAQHMAYAAIAQARAPQPAPPPATDATLPKTATDAEIRILFGILLCLVSLLLLVVRRRHLVPAVRHGR